VLVHGAGGGVGTVAVQLARAAGAHVIATGRGWSRELVTELGAERFVDLDRERFEDVAENVDLVLDLVGGETLRRSGAAVRDGGIVVSAVEDPRPRLDQATRARGAYFVVEPARSELVPQPDGTVLYELLPRSTATDLRHGQGGQSGWRRRG
jgi:NADPH:quinone reductase-like Zn-dependent oxidoreductase